MADAQWLDVVGCALEDGGQHLEDARDGRGVDACSATPESCCQVVEDTQVVSAACVGETQSEPAIVLEPQMWAACLVSVSFPHGASDDTLVMRL